MRIIDTGITKEMLTSDNHPQLKIGDKLYTVDDRQSTYDKILDVQKDTSLDDKEKTKKMYELALGKKEAKEILGLDLSVEKNNFLAFCVMGAVTGQDPKELQKFANEQARKN